MFRRSSLALSLLAACAISALASPTVNSPTNGATVAPEFTLSAVATTCSNQSVSAMGFSLDSSSNTTIVNGTAINATVSATTGSHTLHVKAWGNAGASCVTDVSITVSATSGTTNGVSVTTPGNSSTVTSPFALAADALTCSSQPVSAMGYSIDTGNTTIIYATAINTNVSTSSGEHTLHVKAWGNAGASCVTNVAINVTTAMSTGTSTATTPSGITVSSPANNATVAPPFVLAAAATSCSSQPVTAMGYSLDSSTSTAIVQSTSVAASVTASAGAHTLHVKSWGSAGASCVSDVAIDVVSSTTSTTTSTVTISSPSNGASVNSPFALTSSAATCSSQAVTSMGYSLDNGSTTIVSGTSINTQAYAASGQHTLHVNAWNGAGTVCTSSEAIDVLSASSPTTSIVPSNAIAVSSIQALGNWSMQSDPGTNGSANGTMLMVSAPSLSGNARQFNTSFTNSGGERYHITFGDDTGAANFFYDGWVYLTSSASNVANIEMDMNQVMSNGQTAIYGFQCDGYSGTWDYTENAGTPTEPSDSWMHSSQACNPRTWTQNTWHHIQVSYSRDSVGNVSYHSVWFDGVEYQIDATVPSAFALGWAPILLTNFQIDGLGSGSDTVYLDNLTISRW